MQGGVDAIGPIPKYVEIAGTLQMDIEAGRYRIGEKIPSESELCRAYRENRYTVRQALDLLVNTGLIRSHQGKGHYVCEKPLNLQYTITPAMRFSEVMRSLGCRPGAKVLRKEEEVPPESVRRMLELPEEARAFRLELLRLANDVPLAWNVTWLPAAYFPDLLQAIEPFESLYEVLEGRYGVRLQRIWSKFGATYPNTIEARRLEMTPNQNVLHIESVMRDNLGRLVEYTSAKYRGDLCRVSIEF